jgi:hypothetical protein
MDTSKKIFLIIGCLSCLNIFLGNSLVRQFAAHQGTGDQIVADVPFTSQDQGSPERTVSGTSDPGYSVYSPQHPQA